MLEKALISAVVHQREETVYRVHGARPAALFAALADVERERRHDPAERSDEIVFSAPPEDRAEAARTLDGLGARWEARDDLGKVSVIGAGMKSHPGVAAKTFATLESEGIVPGRRLDLADQDRLPHRVPPGRRRRARTSRCLRPCVAPASASSARRAPSAPSRSSCCSSAASSDVRVFASARSAGKQLGAVHRRGGDARGARARRHRRLPVLGRHRRLPRARAARRARRRARDRQVRRPTGSSPASRSSCRR